MCRKFASVSLVVLFVFAFASAQQLMPKALSLSAAGVATPTPDTVTIAAPLANNGAQPLRGVKIDHIEFAGASLKTSLPIKIGKIAAHGSEIVQAEFATKGLAAGKQYDLVVQGSYRAGGKEDEKDRDDKDSDDKGPRRPFRVRTSVILPPASPGSQDVGKASAPAHKVKGGHYPPQPHTGEKDANQAAPPVPTTSTEHGAPTPTGTGIKQAELGDPPAVNFMANDRVGISGAGLGCSGDTKAACAEPSGASSGGVIFVSANWSVAYSTNGGSSFSVVDPTTVFPADTIGFCCDQIIQYAPSIDRFIWLLQGKTTGYHLAMASPADVKSSGATAWTYWNLSPSLFGKCPLMDYPDLSIGDNSLYISWDSNDTSSGATKGCTPGFQVARTSLTGIKAGGTITLDYTDPANAPQSKIWGEHLTQNTGDEIFWAGHNGNNKLTVYSLKEGSNTYFWRDVSISGWANNAPTSTTPDSQDWLAKNFNGPGGNSFPRNGIIGAARSGNQLWFGWSAGTDKNFKQAHVEIVTLDRGNNFNKTQQVQVWNDSYAFAYPAFSSNGCTGELGMSFEYGGNGNYENHVVGFWGDYVAYITTGSNAGTDRFGDYVSIRRAPVTPKEPGNMFTAFGFGVNKQVLPKKGKSTDVHYILFGRPNCRQR